MKKSELSSSPTVLSRNDDTLFYHTDNNDKTPLYEIDDEGYLHFTEADGSKTRILPEGEKPDPREEKDSYIAISHTSKWIHINGHSNAIVYRPGLPTQEVHLTKKNEPFSGTYIKTLVMPHQGLIASDVAGESSHFQDTGFKNAIIVPVSKSEASNFLHQAFWDGLNNKRYMALSQGGQNCTRYVHRTLERRTHADLSKMVGVNHLDFSPGHFISISKRFAKEAEQKQGAKPYAHITIDSEQSESIEADFYKLEAKDGTSVIFAKSDGARRKFKNPDNDRRYIDPNLHLLFDEFGDLGKIEGEQHLHVDFQKHSGLQKRAGNKERPVGWAERKKAFVLIGKDKYNTAEHQGRLLSRRENNLAYKFWNSVEHAWDHARKKVPALIPVPAKDQDFRPS